MKPKLNLQRNRIIRGQCPDCGKKAKKGHLRCQEHLDYHKRNQLRVRKKRLESGKCTCCGRTRKSKRYLLCKACRDIRKTPKWRKGANASRKRTKDAAYKKYGGYRCKCCSETEEKFLCIDHIDGGGRKHRGYGSYFYYWLKKNDYPKGFQILCHNCNTGRSLNNGICPHKQRRRKVS